MMQRLVLDAENLMSRSASRLFVQRSGGRKLAGVEEDNDVVWNFETVSKSAAFLRSCGVFKFGEPFALIL
jgi:hypothetical protein